jgi:hypothetical protein
MIIKSYMKLIQVFLLPLSVLENIQQNYLIEITTYSRMAQYKLAIRYGDNMGQESSDNISTIKVSTTVNN